MDDSRKYRQRGYQDSDRRSEPSDRPRPQGPRPPLDVTGPRLPRLVQSVTASRCYNCASLLHSGTDWRGACPKCGVALHCCKQCSHFEPSTRFQCVKPIQIRVAKKDELNECELFGPRVTVARDGAAQPVPATVPSQASLSAPRTPQDARAAFDSLFKK